MKDYFGVDPLSWTPHRWSRRETRWQTNRSGTHRSSSDRGSGWCDRGAPRPRCRRSSALRPGRSGYGRSRPPVMRGRGTTGGSVADGEDRRDPPPFTRHLRVAEHPRGVGG
jgi:hypothetical protein